MTRLSDSDLLKGFRLAYAIHPDRAVALCVLWDACVRVALLENLQRRRHGYKLHTPAEGLLQLSIYLASENWERDQESECPRKEPRYKPTSDDRIIRYVKALARNSMDWHSQYGAVAIGCLLFQYAPHQISELAEDVFKSDNIRRVKSTMSRLLKKRFRFMNGNGEVPFVIPTNHQRSLIHRSLAIVAPWAACPAAAPHVSLLETHFANSFQKSEWERLHVLFHPACGGFPQLVNEYNSSFKKGNKMRLEEPENKLGCPQFGTDLVQPPDDDNSPTDRFNPSPLTREEISTIRHSIERNEQRRKKYHESTLRVVVDGEETARFTHNVSPEPFAIPSTASCIEIFGEDEEGELLLAVFPLAPEGLDSKAFEQQVYVGGEQHIELSISLAPKCDTRKNNNFTYNLVWLRYTALYGLPTTTAVAGSVVDDPGDLLPSVLITGSGGITSHYLVEQLLGSGNVGKIYLAQDQRNNTSVVINVIDSPSDEGANERDLRSRFLKEINGLKQLCHPNIARVFDIGTLVDGREYVVMESVLGVNLRTEISSKRMEISEMVDLTRQLSEAIATLHEHSILHRDIKPENILIEHVGDGMRVKLCDFGLMKEINFDAVSSTSDSRSATATERHFTLPSIGSATYMAPEVLRGEVASTQSDIYALAAVLYEVITGKAPFRAGSLAELLELKQTANPIPCDSRPDFPRAARDIISRALMANPRQRYDSVREMGDAFASMLAANEIKRQKALDRKWRKRNRASTSATQSRIGFVELLRDVLFERRSIEDLIMHERFNVLLKRSCARYGRDDNYLSQEELYQEVCLRLLRYSDALKNIRASSEGEFFAWLRTVTRNVFMDKIRLLRVDRNESLDGGSESYNPISSIEARDISRRFSEFIHSLPEKHQKAIELWMSGYNSREVSEMLCSYGIKCSHSTVTLWIKTAIKEFQEQFVERPDTRSSSQ